MIKYKHSLYFLINFIFLTSCGDNPRSEDKKLLAEFMFDNLYASSESDAKCFVKKVNELNDVQWQHLMYDLGIGKYRYANPYINALEEKEVYQKVKDANRLCRTRLR